MGRNVTKYPNDFNSKVIMYAREEYFEGQRLADFINKQHENPKYLPGKKFPENVVSDFFFILIVYQYVNRLWFVFESGQC